MKLSTPLLLASASFVLVATGCRPKPGKGYTEDNTATSNAQAGAGDSSGASGSGGTGASSSGGGSTAVPSPTAPTPARTLGDPKKDDPHQGLPEKSALPKNLEPPK